MSSIERYYHTVRYLKPIQIAGRAWALLPKRRPVLDAPLSRRQRVSAYSSPVPPEPTLIGPDLFKFLNDARVCRGPGWNPAGVPRLWLYNLHYFDDLNAREASQRGTWHCSLLDRWVAENPVGVGPGWEPYPVSKRIVNWVKWALSRNELSPNLALSLAVQAQWLRSRLEYRLLGNHLFANAKALVHVGLFFDGAEAEDWLNCGLNLIERELKEQILADGAHFELSTMYHSAAVEDMLDLVNVMRTYGRKVSSQWLDCLARMRNWLRSMSHPDGGISFFNDAAFGIAPTAAELDQYASRLGLPATSARQAPVEAQEPSGYTAVCQGEVSLICDCAPVGPDYLPGHAHADTLSFELSVGSQRVFVNSGTSLYDSGPERQRQRGTPAHNTVTIDDANSSEVWGGFRVARRARIIRRAVTTTPSTVVVEASHNGYRRLPGKNVHARRWVVTERTVRIEDQITGHFRTAKARFHLHPCVQARVLGQSEIGLVWPGGAARVVFEGAAPVEVRSATWHPGFGLAIENACLVVNFERSALTTRFALGEAA